jgi:hypothetical protein
MYICFRHLAARVPVLPRSLRRVSVPDLHSRTARDDSIAQPQPQPRVGSKAAKQYRPIPQKAAIRFSEALLGDYAVERGAASPLAEYAERER